VSFAFAAEEELKEVSDAELAQMLAPIALYPDSLLTHILISSTYPIEIVEADRWLKKNSGVSNEQRSQLLEEFDWDPSVKALIPFGHVLSQLSEDLSWTQALGDAFLQDESRLLQSIQTLRKQAKLAGSLKEMGKMDIRYEDNNIIILPKEKEVVYVPYYDSRTVYGSWLWGGYPPVYWHSGHRSNVSDFRSFYWAAGVHITFNYFFSDFHWHNRYVMVAAPNRAHYRKYSSRPRRLIVNEGYAKRWSHNPSHRRGVAYKTKKTRNKYFSHGVGVTRAKQQINSERNFKQRLHKTNHEQNSTKSRAVQTRNKSPKQNSNVKLDKKRSKSANIQSGSHQKTRATSEKRVNKNSQTSQKVRSKKTNESKRISSTSRNNQHRSNKAANHKRVSAQKSHSGNTKERK
jgi:hypothetical protein